MSCKTAAQTRWGEAVSMGARGGGDAAAETEVEAGGREEGTGGVGTGKALEGGREGAGEEADGEAEGYVGGAGEEVSGGIIGDVGE